MLLVTGDEAVCGEGRQLLGDGLTTVAVKRSLGRLSARHLTPVRARELIEDGARRALADLGAVKPYDPGRPCEIRVELGASEHSEQFRHSETVEIVDPRMVASRGDDWRTAWRQFYFSYTWPD